jgi:hypothetical protein
VKLEKGGLGISCDVEFLKYQPFLPEKSGLVLGNCFVFNFEIVLFLDFKIVL